MFSPRKTNRARHQPIRKPLNRELGQNFDETVVFAETSSAPVNEVKLETMNRILFLSTRRVKRKVIKY